ncbi:hypothetical protein [Dactylosporangium sp. NPDC049140]|jgi:hypothetical protein|uniref:hypothetical protein n=1 Tax=Dactylosporangium sp. NPDC049140 TaxID=3155647 RepID=UPI0033E41162
MGASGWHARVSYQNDVRAALQQARWDAYRRGAFYRESPNEQARALGEEEYVAWGIADIKASVPPELAGLEWSGDQHRTEWRAAQVVVTGPDSLVDAQPFSGTHSVIDMTGVADEPGHTMVAPAPREYLMELFGTTQPTVAAVEAAIEAHAMHGFGRWHGMYLFGYADRKPVEIFFVGRSGD